MSDIWSFLLQTLTASGVAALLLAVKTMFRDKLSPRWQFAVWGVLAVVLLLPAGWGGRYVLLNWPTCTSVEVSGLSTAFICGVFRPVLALPAGVETDDKVILHELLHLKYKDAAWGLVIAFFRCIHWCSPLIWLCADRAGNDLEALCDQRVLERLEGEDRRDYGRILLSMADEKYARAPGTSSAANGGRNIARRIQAIARFKRYPAGMKLVSVCVALVLAFPLILGARAETINEWRSNNNTVMMASARTTYCTTYAGAFDAYAKALLTGEISYRAMCAPLREQNTLAEAWKGNNRDVSWLWNRAGDVRSRPDTQEGYKIYNLAPTEDGAWEGLLVLALNYTPDDEVEWAGWDSTVSTRWLAVQPLRAEREGERWVVVPLADMKAVQGDVRDGGNLGLPARVYEAQYGDFTIRLQWQTTASVDSCTVSDGLWAVPVFDSVPRPNGTFEKAFQYRMIYALYTGDRLDKAKYTQLGVSVSPVDDDGSSPDLGRPQMGYSNIGGSSVGTDWGNRVLEDEDWDGWIFLTGGGGGCSGPDAEGARFPAAYRGELYLNGRTAAELTLLPVEGGEWLEP